MIWIVLQVIAAKAVLLPLARVLDNMFWGHPVLLLYFVMIMCPLVMNIIQVRIASLFPIILACILPQATFVMALQASVEVTAMQKTHVVPVQALVQDAVLKFRRKHSDAPSESPGASPGDSGRKRADKEQVRLLASQPEFSDGIPLKENHTTLLGRPALQERHSLV